MSSSLLTNTSAMTALMYLTQTQSNLNKVQNEISTGLAVSGPSDNVSYWSIATKMQSDVGALGTIDAALSESQSLVGTMTAALQSTISVMDAIKNDLVTAQNPGANFVAEAGGCVILCRSFARESRWS
jgi:flagellin